MTRDPREIGKPRYHRNEHGALIRTSSSLRQSLDEQGRCCGRKPLVYKRPDLHFFCAICSREYGADGVQRQNWAFKRVAPSEFVENRPISRNDEAEVTP